MVKTKNKLIALIAIFAILLAGFAATNMFTTSKIVYAEDEVATSEWDGTSYADITKGTGTEEDPYLIETAAQFANLSNLVTSGTSNWNSEGVWYKLVANINLKNKQFAGIGAEGQPFKANFDGNNLTISNFRYTTSINNALSTVNAGLFNTIEKGTIKNFNINTARIIITRNGSNYGNLNCGAACGYQTNRATIKNVSVTGATITASLNGSLTQVAVGGVIGRSFNSCQIENTSCIGSTLTTTIGTGVTDLEAINVGLISGTTQSDCSIKNSYCDIPNAVTITSNNTSCSITTRIGGITGCLAVSAYIQKSYSNFSNLNLTTGTNITNNIGGLAGYLNDNAYLTDCYAKNNLFNGAASTNNTSTNHIGGLLGNVNVEQNLFTFGNKLLSSCYVVVDDSELTSQVISNVGAVVGLLNLNNAPAANKTTPTFANTYYIAQNGQNLTDYLVNGGDKYTGQNIVTNISNNNAKNVDNFTGFDTENVWRNDLSPNINDGYPIIMSVGNDVIPNQKQTFQITLNIVTINETGTSEPVAQTLQIQEGAIVTQQITVPENHTAEVAVADGCITAALDENGLLTLSNATANGAVTVTITKASYTVTLAVRDNVGGSVAFASGYSSKVYHGQNVEVDVTPAEGYVFDFFTGVATSEVINVKVQTENGFRLEEITSDLTVTVKFKKVYTIQLQIVVVDENNTPATSTTLSVVEGGSQQYQLTVPQNYSVGVTTQNSNVLTAIEEGNVLVVYSPTGNDTVTVTITKASYTVTLVVKDDVGGNINFATGYSSTVYHGGTSQVVVAADAGYRFDFATGVLLSVSTLTAVQTENGCSVANITSNLTITVSFIKTYTISIETSDSSVGVVSFDNVDFQTTQMVVDEGSDITVYNKFIQNGDKTHRIFGWYNKREGQSQELLSQEEVLTLTNINKDYKILAQYATKYYHIDITINQPENTSNKLQLSKPSSVNPTEYDKSGQFILIEYNQLVTINFIPEQSCYVKSAVLDGTELQITNGTYSYNLLQNGVLVVEFESYVQASVYAYSNTLSNQQSYTSTNLQNFVGFAENPTGISETKNFMQGQNATVYALTSQKYVFDGWYISPDFATNPLSTNSEYTFNVDDRTAVYAKFSINTYTITFKQTLIDENGTNTSTIGMLQSELNGSVQMFINQDLTNYNFVELQSRNTATYNAENKKIIISNILVGDTVTIVFEKQKHTVSLSVGQGGQATIDGNTVTEQQVYYNTGLQIDFAADQGYKFYNNNAQITGSCNSSIEQNYITLQNITSDVSVQLNFTKYFVVTIKPSIADVGYVSFDGADYQNNLQQEFDQGTSVTVYAQLNQAYLNAYKFHRWVDDGNETLTTNLTYVVDNIQSDLNLTAVFLKEGYYVSVSLNQEISNANNKFTINGQNVNYLDGLDYKTDITIQYSLDAGAYLEKVVVSTPAGDQIITAENIVNNTIEFQLNFNIDATVYIKAYKFNVNLSAENGTFKFADGSTTKTLTAYDVVDATAIANEGFEYASTTANVKCFSATTPDQNGVITLSNFTSQGDALTNVNIIVHFNIKTFEVVFNFGPNGNVLLNNFNVYSQTVYHYDYGINLTVKFIANSEYFLNGVQLNGEDISNQISNGVYFISKLQQNLSFNVDFGIKKYNLNLQKEFDDVQLAVYANGNLTAERYFESGTYIEVIANCPQGYNCSGFYDQGNLICQGNSYGFTILQDTNLFAKIYAQVSVNAAEHGYVTIVGSDFGAFEYGANLPVEIFPDLGYQFVGFENGVTMQNNILQVTKTMALTPVFQSKQVQLTLSADQQGTINTNVNGTYVIGDVINITTTILQPGYKLSGYTGQFAGELENELVATYTILPQDAENGVVQIHANMQILTFEVSITSNFGGEVTPYGTHTYNFGHVLSVEFNIYDKYQLLGIDITPNFAPIITENNNFSFVIEQDYNIEFNFAPVLWTNYAQKPQGKGTTDNPFVIKTAEELAFIAAAINQNYTVAAGQVEYDFAYYQLANDINLDGKFWTPIGTTESPFNGVFDFNYFKITNLSVMDDVSQYKYDGLFDVIGQYGKIINQFRDYTLLVVFIVVGSVILVLLVLLIIFIEKRHKKPKRVIVLPPHLRNNNVVKTGSENISKPDISKLRKK